MSCISYSKVYYRLPTRVFGAEEGVTGVLAAAALDTTTTGGEQGERGGGAQEEEKKGDGWGGINHYGDMRERFTTQRMAELDAEGRALVVDFGSFMLINLYVPSVSSVSKVDYDTVWQNYYYHIKRPKG